MRYLTPKTLDDALAAMAEAPLAVLAGGTDVYPALRDRPLNADTLDIGRIGALHGIVREDDGWRIGAGTTWTDLIRAPLPAAFDGLKLAAREIGSVQIQNAATLVGNLCNASPAADGVPCLLALDSVVELRSASGTRALPLRDFISGVRETVRRSDELATAILIPAPPKDAQSGFLKLGGRTYLVISIAMVACVIAVEEDRLTHVRIAVGSCSPVAARLRALEEALTGLSLDAALSVKIAPEHLAPLSPIDDVRATTAYRIEAAQTLIARTLAQALPREATA